MKASEKQELTKKLVARLEKQLGAAPEIPERSVLDTLLYAICLENDSFESAGRSYEALYTEFHDLNEMRVSAISELAIPFEHQHEAGLRANRVRTVLQYVFEDRYEFDFEAIRKKTQDQAAKKLQQIQGLSPFVRNYVQQAALGAHLVPLDDRQTAAVIWLGLAEPNTSPEAAAEQLKPALRKAEAPAFCRLLRKFATSSTAAELFAPDSFEPPEEGYSAVDALKRVDEALGKKPRAAGKAAPSKTAKAKPVKAAKTVKAKKATKTAKTTASRKVDGKKQEATKKTAKKPAGSKRTTSNTSAKKRSRAAS